MSLYYLKTGEFRSLSMTRQGQVLLDAKPQVFSVIDQDTLDTGWIALHAFGRTGRWRPQCTCSRGTWGLRCSWRACRAGNWTGWSMSILTTICGLILLMLPHGFNMDLPLLGFIASAHQKETYGSQAQSLEAEHELTHVSDDIDSYGFD
ncbi:hypothetical protein BP00DRAFT_446260 [Aspergillus indologenus CBS 114.80]|uniref:Uncharacterized protein n=1 Tax=Aspergillus indologenus CBS 114.80 TaxID=1450541 RepID=A0A2V5J9T8_9EURO|nr:hypothetical protein BP00DRAFT_446260 [Aspergillus indologenus CBS 114.80]